MVRTPLWSRENPDKIKSVGEGDIWIEPSEIAEVLLKLCENRAYKGGTILEASGQGRTRVALISNDPGLSTVGHDKGAHTSLGDGVFERLAKERSSRL